MSIEKRRFLFLVFMLVVFSVVSTIVSWNFFNVEVRVPVYSNEEGLQGGAKVGFEIISEEKSSVEVENG